MASKKNRPKKMPFDPLAQLGIPDMSNLDVDSNDDIGTDDDLESELQALLSGKDIRVASRANKKTPMDIVAIEKIASQHLEDVPDEDDEGSVSGDDELMAELHALTTTAENLEVKEENAVKASEASAGSIAMLEERLNLYQQAVEAAKQATDTSRVRRYGRAIKTLENLLKAAKSGHVIDEKDIPPVVAIPKPKACVTTDEGSKKSSVVDQATPMEIISPESSSLNNAGTGVNNVDAEMNRPVLPTRSAPPVPPAVISACETSRSTHSELTLRRDQYKLAALKAKRSGDIETALKYVKIAKKFDTVIIAEENGQPVDLTDMPPPPPEISTEKQKSNPHIDNTTAVQNERMQTSGASELEAAAIAAIAAEPVNPDLFKAPPPPATVLEALQQRLERYCSTRDAAKAEGNDSKARRLQRIVQQYEAAIKSYKAGKTVSFEDLPCPPGFGPIPTNVESFPQTVSKHTISKPAIPSSNAKKAAPDVLDEKNKSESGPPPKKESTSGKPPKIQRANTSSILDKQLRFLLERQKLFRQAALESKKKGDIQQAKEYLRMSKGFDSMIEATRNGLPIDATAIPTPPQLEADFVIVDVSECSDEKSNCSSTELYANLEKELQKQIEMCNQNKDHFMHLGDVTSASKFEKLALDTKKDLVFIQHLWRNNEPVPIFHYETRLFSLVQCNTDLADNELEVIVERGINLPGKPNELDAYVKIEFAIPPETPQRAKTHTVKDTNNPTFHESFKFDINRKSRSQIRQFKKQVLKFEVFSKGWFFKGDTLLGTINLKLTDLETKCSIHQSFDLMDGRKTTGGKLEVQVKVRDPLLVKQVEEVREKWLVIRS